MRGSFTTLGGMLMVRSSLVGAVITAFLSAGLANTAGRATPALEAELAITAITPSVPTSGSGVSLTGRVGGASIGTACDIIIGLSKIQVTSRSELRTLTTNSTAATRRAVRAATIARTTSDAQTGEWSTRVSASTLGLTTATAAGVYPLTVTADCGNSITRAATVLPWLPRRSAVSASSLMLLWPVAVAPLRNLGNIWNDAALAAQLQPFGRLRSLLDAGRDAPVSWLLDPETIDTIALAAGRADAAGATRTGLNGQTQDLAAAWLDDLADVTSQQPVIALARAVPDAMLASNNKARGWVRSAQDSAVADLNSVLGSDNAIADVAAWPCAREPRCLRRADLQALTSSGPNRPLVTVLPDSVAPVVRDVYWSAGAVTRMPLSDNPTAVVTDGILDVTLATGDGITEPAMLQQRIIGDLALITLERPKSARTLATTIALGLPTQESLTGAVAAAKALAAASAAGFIKAAQLADVTDLPADRTERKIRFSTTGPESSSVMASIRNAAIDSRAGAQLLTARADRVQWNRETYLASLNSTSLMWRGKFPSQKRYVRTFYRGAKARRTGVHVTTASRVYLGRSNGTIPFTVINTLDRAVTVYPQLSGWPRARIDLAQPPQMLQLGPGERAGVPIGARLLGSGSITVAFSVLSQDGEVISTPARTVVSTNAYARIAQYLVFAAFGLLLLLVLNNIRRTVRRRRHGEQGDGHTAVDMPANDGDGVPDPERGTLT